MSAGDVANNDMSPARRWYRRLLRLGPRALRAAHGTEMEDLFLDALHDASARGRAATARVWCAAMWDLLRASVARPFRRRPVNRQGQSEKGVSSCWEAI